MKLSPTIVALALAGVLPRYAHADDQAYAHLVELVRAHSAAPPCPLLLTAAPSSKPNGAGLRFTLTNVSTKPIVLDEDTLPWSGDYSITFAALDLNGKPLSIGYPIHDVFLPPPTVTIAPRQTLTGTYDLIGMLGIGVLPRDSELTILWAFVVKERGTSKAQQPVCTGITNLRTER